MGKQKQNYFDQAIRQYGEDFITRITPENIQKSAKRRIFREMIQGQIDYIEFGRYFQDPKFFENLLIAAYDELQTNSIILRAITEYDLHHPGNNQVILLKGRYNSLVYVYNVLYNSMIQMKMDGYNVGHLSNLSAILYQYRNQI